jgi:hypothetical protein
MIHFVVSPFCSHERPRYDHGEQYSEGTASTRAKPHPTGRLSEYDDAGSLFN